MSLEYNMPAGYIPPVAFHFADATGAFDFLASGDSDVYEKLELAPGQTSPEQRIVNLIEHGRSGVALQQINKALEKMTADTFNRTIKVALHALQLMERAGDNQIASILRHMIPEYRIDHEGRFIPAAKAKVHQPVLKPVQPPAFAPPTPVMRSRR